MLQLACKIYFALRASSAASPFWIFQKLHLNEVLNEVSEISKMANEKSKQKNKASKNNIQIVCILRSPYIHLSKIMNTENK